MLHGRFRQTDRQRGGVNFQFTLIIWIIAALIKIWIMTVSKISAPTAFLPVERFVVLRADHPCAKTTTETVFNTASITNRCRWQNVCLTLTTLADNQTVFKPIKRLREIRPCHLATAALTAIYSASFWMVQLIPSRLDRTEGMAVRIFATTSSGGA